MSPKTCRDKVQAEMFARWREHCEHIDKHLLNGGRTFATDAFETKDIERMVIKTYRDAGWVVAVVADQRDGDYLEFKEPRK